MKNLGEEIKETTLVEIILRSLSSITVVQIHWILTTFGMRKGGPSDIREAAFKASTKRK